MTSPTVDENPEPGESGYYSWHEAVAKHHNDKAGMGAHHAASRVSVTASGLAVVSSTDVQGALADLDAGKITAPDSPSDGDALVWDGTAWTADSGTYRKDDRPLVAPAGAFGATKGSPSMVRFAFRWGAVAMDDASHEQIGGALVDVPAAWSTYDLELWHTTSTGNSGDAGIKARALTPSSGDDLGTEDKAVGVMGVTAVATADTLGVETLWSGVTAVAGPTMLELERIGGDAQDTLTGDFLVIALVLRKAS